MPFSLQSDFLLSISTGRPIKIWQCSVRIENMSVHLQYLKHLQRRRLCTVVCVWMWMRYASSSQNWETTYRIDAAHVYLKVKSVLHNKYGGRGSDTRRLVVYDQMRSEGHHGPGFDLTALFTVMHSSLSYLKLERLCFTCSGCKSLSLRQQTGPLSFAFLRSSALRSKPKANSNQSHTATPANTYSTM